MSFHILTDSCCELPDEIHSQYKNFSMIELTYTIDGQEASLAMPEKEFYDRLRNGAYAKTSQVVPSTFEEKYREIFNSGENEILYLGFSKALSGTFANGKIAAETVTKKDNQRIITIDTYSASLGMGALVDYAIELRDSGKSMDEVAEWVEQNKLKMNHWFTVDDLKYLQRGGRLTTSAAFIGGILNIKPVMHVNNEGRLIPLEKMMGRKKAIKRLFQKMEEMVVNPEEQKIYISHGDCLEEAEMLAEMVREKYKVRDLIIGYNRKVIGSHTGQGVLALFFLGDHR
jgi:DegV family protein with EDD domain